MISTGASGAARGTPDYKWPTGRLLIGVRLFSYCTQTKNVKNFQKRVVNKCTVLMLSGLVVANHHLP